MKVDNEMRIPYVSKEICRYLRDTYSLPNVLTDTGTGRTMGVQDSSFTLGIMVGVNKAIERLEAIVAQQEGDID